MPAKPILFLTFAHPSGNGSSLVLNSLKDNWQRKKEAIIPPSLLPKLPQQQATITQTTATHSASVSLAVALPVTGKVGAGAA